MSESEKDEFLEYKKDWTLEELNNDIDSLAKHPLFEKDLTHNKDTPEHKALQNLLYDEDDVNAAENFYNQGNKILTTYIIGKNPTKHDENYFLHQALFKYNEAVECKIIESELKAKVLCNRALVNTKLKNYGKAIQDAQNAIEIDKSYAKAYYRKAFAEDALDKFELALSTCDEALAMGENKEINELKSKIKTKINKNNEKKKNLELQKQMIAQELFLHLKKHEILYSNQPTLQIPESYQHVFKVENDYIVTSVLFIYPEFGQFDFIDEAADSNMVSEVFDTVYGEGLPWDEHGYYKDVSNIEFFIELNSKQPLNNPEYIKRPIKLSKINAELDLLSLMKIPEYVIPKVIEIIVLSKASNFYSYFINKYSN